MIEVSLAATQGRRTIGRVLAFQAALGEALWRPPAPNGYPDTEAAWIDGVPRRLDIANEFAGRMRDRKSIRSMLLERSSARSPPPTRARPWREPKPAPKPLRFSSWHRNSCRR